MNIEAIAVGQWVLARNPEITEAKRTEATAAWDGEQFDPAGWRTVTLRMTKRDGTRLDITLLRPLQWLAAAGVQVDADRTRCETVPASATIELELEELGASGPARVFPLGRVWRLVLAPGPDCHLVTGTFRHQAAEVLTLAVRTAGGRTKNIGVTANHPFWSVDRQAFVPAGRLQVGERLGSFFDQEVLVVSITPRGPPEQVYNLEVAGEHVYQITCKGLLVHNNCIGARLSTREKDLLRAEARSLWKRCTGSLASAKGLKIHHRVPLEWSHVFPKVNPNRMTNLVGVDEVTHKAINRLWAEFRRALGGRTPTQAEIMRKVLEIDKLFGHRFILP